MKKQSFEREIKGEWSEEVRSCTIVSVDCNEESELEACLSFQTNAQVRHQMPDDFCSMELWKVTTLRKQKRGLNALSSLLPLPIICMHKLERPGSSTFFALKPIGFSPPGARMQSLTRSRACVVHTHSTCVVIITTDPRELVADRFSVVRTMRTVNRSFRPNLKTEYASLHKTYGAPYPYLT